MNLNEDLLIWNQASVNPCLSFKFFFLCIRKLVSRLLVENTQSVVTWCPSPRGGRGFFLVIFFWGFAAGWVACLLLD